MLNWRIYIRLQINKYFQICYLTIIMRYVILFNTISCVFIFLIKNSVCHTQIYL